MRGGHKRGEERAASPAPDNGASAPTTPALVVSSDWVETVTDFDEGTLSNATVTDAGIMLQRGPGGYAAEGLYVSPAHDFMPAFNLLGARWSVETPEGTRVDLEARLAGADDDWTDWLPLEAEHFAPQEGWLATELATPPRTRCQYRVRLTTATLDRTPIFRGVAFTGVNSLVGPEVPAAVVQDDATDGPRIIPRAEWGANEALMTYPPEYTTVHKLIVHHTVTSNEDADPAATVRAIYYYHAKQLDWGDIGYNFVIDAQGRVYEGRKGGPGVIGIHAGDANDNSVGISLLGNFRDAEPTDEAVNALVDLLHAKCAEHKVDPRGHSVYLGQDRANILGHRDVMATQCPGDRLYEQFQAIRTRVWERMEDQTPTVQIVSPQPNAEIGAFADVVAESQSMSLQRVDFYLDNVQVASAPAAPYRWEWVTAGALTGPHVLKATARTHSGLTASHRREVTSVEPATQAYLPDCTAQPPFDTWLTLTNLAKTEARAWGLFLGEDGRNLTREFKVPAQGQVTAQTGRDAPPAAYSAKIVSDTRVLVEKTSFMEQDGYALAGVRQPARRWYFALGDAREKRDTWLVVMNPNPLDVDVTLTLCSSKGKKANYPLMVGALARKSVNLTKLVGGEYFTIVLDSLRPVVAERVTYFGGGSHSTAGSPELARVWHFAEGCTAAPFETWLALGNPLAGKQQVQVTMLPDGAAPVVKTYEVGATSALLVSLAAEAPDKSFGLKVEAAEPLVAERVMYCGKGRAGHAATGRATIARNWAVPTGYVKRSAQVWLLAANPNPESTRVTFKLMTGGQTAAVRELIVAGQRRVGLNLNELAKDLPAITQVEADLPVAVERAVYFNSGNGATCAWGTPLA